MDNNKFLTYSREEQTKIMLQAIIDESTKDASYYLTAPWTEQIRYM